MQLLFCFIVVAATWVLLGFRPAYSVMGNDAIKLFLPILTLLKDIGGDFGALVYRPEYFGGANLLGLRGALPLSVVMAKAGLPAIWTLNADVFVAQALVGFLATQAVRSLAGSPPGFATRRDLFVTAGITWLIGFSPLMGWRINAGHINLVYGLAAFVALVTLWMTITRGNLTRVTALAVVVTLASAFCVQGFQVLVYGVVICGPMLLALAYISAEGDWRRIGKTTVACAGVAIVALMIAAPVFLAMFAFATSTETTRSPGHDMAIYSYFVASWRECVNVLPWFEHPISNLTQGRPLETRYGLGPALLLLPLLGRGRGRTFIVATVCSLAFGFVLAARIEPVAGWLLHIPILGDYRVPMRLFMPLTTLCTMVVVAEVLKAIDRDRQVLGRATLLLFVLAAMLVLLLTPIGKETLVLLLALIVLFSILRQRLAMLVPTVMMLVALDLYAFAGTVAIDSKAGEFLEANRGVGASLIKDYPALRMPLNRIDTNIDTFGLATSSVGKLTSITGYGFPSRQYSILVHDLVGAPYSPTESYFNPTHKLRYFYVVQQLYNIQYQLYWMDEDKVGLIPLAITPGPIWASVRQKRFQDQHELDAAMMKSLGQDDWQTSQYVTSPTGIPGGSPTCSRLKFATPRFTQHESHVEINVDNAAQAPCPVTISMNWSSNLAAWVRTKDGTTPVTLYPAYGTLVGLTLPPGATAISIHAAPKYYRISMMLAALGMLAVVVLLFRIGAGGWLGDRAVDPK